MTKLRSETDDHQRFEQQKQQQQQEQQQQAKPKDPTRTHQIYVIFHRQLKKRVRDGAGASSSSGAAVRIQYIQTTEVAGLSHDKLYGIHVLLLLKRILQLASENGDALDFDHLAHSVHNALFFSMEQGFKPLTPPKGTDPNIWSLDKSVQLVLTENGELPLQQKCTECFSIVDLRRIENPGYAIINPFNEGRRVDVQMGVPLSAASYAAVYEEEDKKLFWKDYQTEIDAVLGFFKKQRLLRASEIRTFWPRVVCSGVEDEEAMLEHPKTKHEMEKLQDMASKVFVSLFATSSSSSLTASDRRQWTLDRLPPRLRFRCFKTISRLRLLTDVDLETWTRFCGEGAAVAAAAASPIPSVAVNASGGGKLIAWDDLEKQIVENINLSRCLGTSRAAFLDMVSMGGKFLKEVDVSWTDLVNDDVINNLVISCPNLQLLKANGCKNINGSNLRHEALIHLDAAHNLDGIHMDIYIFYKSFRHNGKIVMGKLRHSWLYGRAALHFTLRILKFCYFHKLAHVDDYESYEGLLQRYLFVDPAMPYYHRNIEIIHENLYPSPFKHASAYESRRLRPRVCNGPVPLAPTGYPALVIDMTGIQPNQYPYFSFVSRPWGQPEEVHALSPEQYLNIFYPEGGVYSEMCNFPTMEKDIKRLLKEFRLQRHRLESHNIMRVYDSFLKGEKDIFDRSRSPSPQIAFLDDDDDVSTDRERSASVPKAVLESRLDPGERGFKHPSSIPVNIPTRKPEEPLLDIPERGRLSRPVGSPHSGDFSSDEEEELHQDGREKRINARPSIGIRKSKPGEEIAKDSEPGGEANKLAAVSVPDDVNVDDGSKTGVVADAVVDANTKHEGVGDDVIDDQQDDHVFQKIKNFFWKKGGNLLAPLIPSGTTTTSTSTSDLETNSRLSGSILPSSANPSTGECSVAGALLQLPFDLGSLKSDTAEDNQIDSGVCGSPRSLRSEENGVKEPLKVRQEEKDFSPGSSTLSQKECHRENKSRSDYADEGPSVKLEVGADKQAARNIYGPVGQLDLSTDQPAARKRLAVTEAEAVAERGRESRESHSRVCSPSGEQSETDGLGRHSKSRRTDRPKRPPRRRVVGKRAQEFLEEEDKADAADAVTAAATAPETAAATEAETAAVSAVEMEATTVDSGEKYCGKVDKRHTLTFREITPTNEKSVQPKAILSTNERSGQSSVVAQVEIIKTPAMEIDAERFSPLKDAECEKILSRRIDFVNDDVRGSSHHDFRETLHEKKSEFLRNRIGQMGENNEADLFENEMKSHFSVSSNLEAKENISDLDRDDAAVDILNDNVKTNKVAVNESSRGNFQREPSNDPSQSPSLAITTSYSSSSTPDCVLPGSLNYSNGEKEEFAGDGSGKPGWTFKELSPDDEEDKQKHNAFEESENDEDEYGSEGASTDGVGTIQWTGFPEPKRYTEHVNYDKLDIELDIVPIEEEEEPSTRGNKWEQHAINYNAIYNSAGQDDDDDDDDDAAEEENVRVNKWGQQAVNYDALYNLIGGGEGNMEEEEEEEHHKVNQWGQQDINYDALYEQGNDEIEVVEAEEEEEEEPQKVNKWEQQLVNYDALYEQGDEEVEAEQGEEEEKEEDFEPLKENKWAHYAVNYDALYGHGDDEFEEKVNDTEKHKEDEEEEEEPEKINKWAHHTINYDALYDQGDEELEEADKDETERGVGEEEGEESESVNRWAQQTFNYDALYDQGGMDVKEVEECEEEKGEDSEEGALERVNKWAQHAINYDVLYEQEDVKVEDEVKDEEEREGKEEAERVNKWAQHAINYDALYEQSDDKVEDEVKHDYKRYEEGEEEVSEGVNKWGQHVLNYAILDQVDDKMEVVVKDDEKAESHRVNNWAQHAVDYDVLYDLGDHNTECEAKDESIDKGQTGEEEVDEVAQRVNKWAEHAVNYDALYDQVEDPMEDEAEDEEKVGEDGNPGKVNKWAQQIVNYDALYDQGNLEETLEEVERSEDEEVSSKAKKWGEQLVDYEAINDAIIEEEAVQEVCGDLVAMEKSDNSVLASKHGDSEETCNESESEVPPEDSSHSEANEGHEALRKQGEQESNFNLSVNCDNILHVMQSSKDGEDDEGYQTEASSRYKLEKVSSVKRVVVGDKAGQTEAESQLPIGLVDNQVVLTVRKTDSCKNLTNSAETDEAVNANSKKENPMEEINSEPNKTEKKPPWEMNWDSNWDWDWGSQDNIIVDTLKSDLKKEDASEDSNPESALGRNVQESESKHTISNEALFDQTHDVVKYQLKSDEYKEEEKENKTQRANKWAQQVVNYDALYNQENNEGDDQVKDTEEKDMEEVIQRQSKWAQLAVDYEALYELVDDEVEDELKEENKQKDEQSDKEPQRVSKWAHHPVNYDALYDQDGGDVEDQENEMKVKGEEEEKDLYERKNKWAQYTVNYEALYNQEDEEISEEEKEELRDTKPQGVEKLDHYSVNYDVLPDQGEGEVEGKVEDVEEEGKEEEKREEVSQRNNAWGQYAINYDALYEQIDDEVEDEVKGEEEEVEEKWANQSVNYDVLYDQRLEEVIDQVKDVEEKGNGNGKEVSQRQNKGDDDIKDEVEGKEDKEKEHEEEVSLRVNKWAHHAINYDALYDHEEEKVEDELKCEKEEGEEVSEYDNKLAEDLVNYDATYDKGNYKTKIDLKDEEIAEGQVQDGEKEDKGVKRWAQVVLNYDALYDQEIDIAEDVVANHEDKGEEVGEEKPQKVNKWVHHAINYDALYDQGDFEMDVEICVEEDINSEGVGKEEDVQGVNESNQLQVNHEALCEKGEHKGKTKVEEEDDKVDVDALNDEHPTQMGEQVEILAESTENKKENVSLSSVGGKAPIEVFEAENDIDVQPRWQRNYDLETQPSQEEADGKDSTKFLKNSNFPEQIQETIKDDELPNTENNDTSTQNSRWGAYQIVNYDVLYAGQEEQVDADNLSTTEDDLLISHREATAEECLQEKDVASVIDPDCDGNKEVGSELEEEEQEYKPRWEINYDALYEAEDDLMQQVEEDEEELSSISEKGHPTEDSNLLASKGIIEVGEDAINVKASEPDEEQEYKPRWEINYEALYEVQDDLTQQVEEENEKELHSITTTDKSVSKGSVKTEEGVNEEEKASEPEEEELEYKPRWEINYDALYEAQDDLMQHVEEVDKKDLLSVSRELQPIDTMEEIASNGINEPKEDCSHEDEEQEYKPRWEVNYEALYEAQDELMELVEEDNDGESLMKPHFLEEMIKDANIDIYESGKDGNNEENTEPEEKQECKPRWEVNYDVFYEAQDELIQQVEIGNGGELSVEPSSLADRVMDSNQGIIDSGKDVNNDEKAEPEEEQECKPRWDVNYDALYEVQDNFLQEEKEYVMEEVISVSMEDHTLEMKHEDTSEGPTEAEDVSEEEYKPRWEVNYDALYAIDDDAIGENDEVIASKEDIQAEPQTESEFEDEKPNLAVNENDSDHQTTSDTTDTEVESLRSVILNRSSDQKGKDSEGSCNEDEILTPKYIPTSPPTDPSFIEPPSNIPSNPKSRQMKKYGRRDTDAINSTQKQKTDLLLESVQEKLLAAVQEEEEVTSSQDSSNEEKDDSESVRRSRESKAPERDILFGELKSMSSGDLSPIVEDEDEEENTKGNDLSKLKTLIPGIAEIGSPGIMSPIPVCGTNSQERTSWGEWMDKFIPSYGECKPEEFDGDDEDEKYERDSEISELDSVYSEFDSEYQSDDDDVIEYESYQEIEDNLFVMQAVKQQRPWADVDERDTLKVLRNANGNKQETIIQLIELDKERCKLLGLE